MEWAKFSIKKILIPTPKNKTEVKKGYLTLADMVQRFIKRSSEISG